MNDCFVVIDFCGTVVDFQTFNPFMELCLEKKRRSCFFVNHIKARRLAQRAIARLFKRDFYKYYLIRKMKGVSELDIKEIAKEYYKKTVSARIIKEVISRIDDYKKEKAKTIILSAGGYDYISYFAKEYGIDYVVANHFAYKKGKCVGRLSGPDCIGFQKKEYLEKVLLDVSRKPVIIAALSDSDSDLPILEMAKDKIVISNKKHQSWVSSDMEEIIYE